MVLAAIVLAVGSSRRQLRCQRIMTPTQGSTTLVQCCYETQFLEQNAPPGLISGPPRDSTKMLGNVTLFSCSLANPQIKIGASWRLCSDCAAILQQLGPHGRRSENAIQPCRISRIPLFRLEAKVVNMEPSRQAFPFALLSLLSWFVWPFWLPRHQLEFLFLQTQQRLLVMLW